MDANNSFYVKFIATYATIFLGVIILVLAMVVALWYGPLVDIPFGVLWNLLFYLGYAQYERYLPVTYFSRLYLMILIKHELSLCRKMQLPR